MTHRVLGLIVTLGLVAPLVVGAQQAAKVYRIGFISSSTTSATAPSLVALREGLRELGYIEGKNVVLEYRFAESREQLPALAAELVGLPVDLILAGGSEGISAAQKATRTIPIVMTNSGDPVKAGYIASLARPGGNITGLTQISPDLAGKRLQLLKEVAPRMVRVGVLWNPAHPTTPLTFKETQAAAQSLGLQMVSLEVKEPKGFEEAFTLAARQQVAGLVVLRDPFTARHRTLIADMARKSRLPTMNDTADYVEAGGLIFYGSNFTDLFRRSALYVDKILKGAKPGELPVEQPSKFDMVINLKTAKALGLTIPPSVLARADEVIQ